MEDNAIDASRLLLKVREQMAVPCVIGGMFVTTGYQRARALFPADCRLVVGEGETALLKICSDISGIEDPGADRPYRSPEEWPWLYRPHLQDYLDIGAPINMKTSRGCPGTCRFCATPSLPYGLNKWCGRRISDVADEMQHLCEQYTPHAFNFVDDDFGSLERVEALAEELCKRHLRCALSLQLRAATVYNAVNLEDRMLKLKKGGLCRVFIGLESFDGQALGYFNKQLDPMKALEAFLAIRRAGVAIHIGYILWHPLSTIISVRNEAKMLRDSGFFTTKIVMAKLQVFPGCGLQQEEINAHRSDSLDIYYETVKDKIAPLYDTWLIGALDVPRQYCLAYLDPCGEAPKRVIEIENALERVDDLSYLVLMDAESVTSPEIAAVADSVKERLYEIGCTFNSFGRG
jgi:radical SAM superfamily enzyme YgiQ (UPF0313 family)